MLLPAPGIFRHDIHNNTDTGGEQPGQSANWHNVCVSCIGLAKSMAYLHTYLYLYMEVFKLTKRNCVMFDRVLRTGMQCVDEGNF